VRYFVLVMLLSAGPVQAGSTSYDKQGDWVQESPDDIECVARMEGFTVIYTYRSDHPPTTMPAKGLACFTRNYEAQATTFRALDNDFNEYWKTVK
jgi:hypothetical protein